MPPVSIEFSFSIGPQLGVKTAKGLEADLSIASVELINVKSTFKDGKVVRTNKLGAIETTNGNKNTGLKVTNEVGFSFLGWGGGVGMSRQMDGDLGESDFKSYTKMSTAFEVVDGLAASTTVINETDKEGNETSRSESSFTVGLKAILGVEVKVTLEQQQN